jgi:hypothetical protein
MLNGCLAVAACTATAVDEGTKLWTLVRKMLVNFYGQGPPPAANLKKLSQVGLLSYKEGPKNLDVVVMLLMMCTFCIS